MKAEKDQTPLVTCEADVCSGRGPTRREFLQSTGCFGVAIAFLGLSSKDASALPVGLTEGTQSGGERQYPIPTADGVNIDRQGQLIVVRFSGHVYVFALSCPHQNNALKWVQKDLRFQCTKHDSHYLADGLHVSGRATRNMDRLGVRVENDMLVVDVNKFYKSDKDPAGWAAATVAI